MKKIIVSLFAASTLFVGAPLPAMAGIDVAAVCDGSVPDAWNRPGGFCDQNNFNNSLSDSNEAGCEPFIELGMLGGDSEIRMLVAGRPAGCCAMPAKFKPDLSKGSVIVADYDPCSPP